VIAPVVVSPNVVLPPQDFTFAASRSSGPGGQNVNRVASKVELRFDLVGTRALSSPEKSRLRSLAAGKLDAEGRVVVTSQLTRDQVRNLEDARDKIRTLVAQALVVPKARKKTRPSRSAVERRLDEKRRAGARKALRRDASD
jgi:ribosome-associated protein